MTTELINPPTNAALVVPREVAVGALCEKITQGVRLRKLRIWSVGQLDRARELKQAWTLSVTKLLIQMFGTETDAEEFNRWAGKILPEFASLNQFIERYHDEIDQRLKNLVAVLRRVEVKEEPGTGPSETQALEEVEKSVEAASQERAGVAVEQTTETAPMASILDEGMVEKAEDGVAGHIATRSGALILHLRDEAVEESLSRFVTMLGYELTVVGTEDVGTKALLGKLSSAPGLEFAIVLTGRAQDGLAESKPGASWEFELGYCVGRLGAARVCVLHTGGISVFYDEHGLLHIPVDPAEGWQLQLARQLKRAGIQIDLNRLC